VPKTVLYPNETLPIMKDEKPISQ